MAAVRSSPGYVSQHGHMTGTLESLFSPEMSDTVTKLREALAECPICMDEFDEFSKIPRRMSCCGQPICQTCLTSHVRGIKNFSCPLCTIDVALPGGAECLPKDLTVLRFLDVMKNSRDALPSCTDCPDNDKAMATCEECGMYFCETCFKAHARHRSTRNHQTSTFKDITARSPTRLQSTNTGGTSRVDHSEIQNKLDKVTMRMTNLSGIKDNIQTSQKKAIELINKRFDDMVGELQQRRRLLLSHVEAKADRELKSIRRSLISHKALKDKLESASTTGQSAASLLQETPEDVEAEGIAVIFIEANMEQLLSTIQSTGQVRLVTFSPTQRPSYVPEDALYNSVMFTPDDYPEVKQADVKYSTGNKDVFVPYLEFNQDTSSNDIKISSGVVSNINQDPLPQDTGCRLQSARRALTLRALIPKRGQVVVFSTRLVFTVKQLTQNTMVLWEMTVTGAPVDTDWGQSSGLTVQVSICCKHKQKLCLWVLYHRKVLTDVPLCRYQVGVSRDVNLCIVIDGDTNKIHVVDASDVKVVKRATVPLDRPLWVMMYVDSPSRTEMKSELISGRELILTPEMKKLLSSLI